jgi:hypothetical protein
MRQCLDDSDNSMTSTLIIIEAPICDTCVSHAASQTKYQVVDAAVSKLQTALGGSLSIQGMIDAEEETIAEAIAKVGFWRRKTGFVAFSTLGPLFSAVSFPTLF